MRPWNILTKLLLISILALSASGVVNAKVASGPQNLSPGLHQGETGFNPLTHLAKIDFSTTLTPGSPVVTKSTSFKNLRPNDPILTPSTDTIANIQKTTQSGKFNYVVTQDGKLVLGRSGQSRPNGHINLAQGRDVLAAGEAKFVNGQLRYIDNFSGHYQPSGQAAQNAALQAFERAGVKPSQGYIERKF